MALASHLDATKSVIFHFKKSVIIHSLIFWPNLTHNSLTYREKIKLIKL